MYQLASYHKTLHVFLVESLFVPGRIALGDAHVACGRRPHGGSGGGKERRRLWDAFGAGVGMLCGSDYAPRRRMAGVYTVSVRARSLTYAGLVFRLVDYFAVVSPLSLLLLLLLFVLDFIIREHDGWVTSRR